jgi:universal stress protein D
MAYKHIGVAISGNEEDALLVNKALELARHNDAHLTLIHIDDGLSELYPGIYFPATEDILQLLKNKSDNKLYKLTKNIQWPKTKLRIERGEMRITIAVWSCKFLDGCLFQDSTLLTRATDIVLIGASHNKRYCQ